jgi:hypothetical protein
MMKESYSKELWFLIVGPSIWCVHFLISYVAAAVVCAKLPSASFGGLRLFLLTLTGVALVGIAAAGIRGLKHHLSGVDEPLPHEDPTSGDRQRFLGYATLLLAGLSAIGTLFVALPLVFFESCR